MKRAIALFLVLSSLRLEAQAYPITGINISLPSNPDALTANWGSGAGVFSISAATPLKSGRLDPAAAESRILVVIKKGGNRLCGAYTASSAPAARFTAATKMWSGKDAAALLGQGCTLPPGDYEICVQFFGTVNGNVRPLSSEGRRAFAIGGNGPIVVQAPKAIAPANGSVLSEQEVTQPITFRWTPVVPRPMEELVHYRVSVWQLMQGQTGTQAMRTNQPIITKDVDNLTQTVARLTSGPCLPPHTCDFVWTVQALNREGKPIGGDSGTAELFRFTVSPSVRARR